MWLKGFPFIYSSAYTCVGTEHMLRSENSFWELALSLHVLPNFKLGSLGLVAGPTEPSYWPPELFEDVAVFLFVCI